MSCCLNKSALQSRKQAVDGSLTAYRYAQEPSKVASVWPYQWRIELMAGEDRGCRSCCVQTSLHMWQIELMASQAGGRR